MLVKELIAFLQGMPEGTECMMADGKRVVQAIVVDGACIITDDMEVENE